MEDFDFQENSREMFDKVCQATPFLFRHFTRNGLIQGLKERGGAGCGSKNNKARVVVTEAIMYDVCKQVTPEKHLENTLKILDECKTTTTT